MFESAEIILINPLLSVIQLPSPTIHSLSCKLHPQRLQSLLYSRVKEKTKEKKKKQQQANRPNDEGLFHPCIISEIFFVSCHCWVNFQNVCT